MTLLWAFWHIVIRGHHIDTTRPLPGVVINHCDCGRNRAYSEPLWITPRQEKRP